MTRTTWRGVTVDERTAHMLDHVAAHTPDDLVVTPTQGCYTTATSASAGTPSAAATPARSPNFHGRCPYNFDRNAARVIPARLAISS
jgi:hypothetical protein